MSIPNEQLERWKQIAQIISAVLIPVVLAVIGYFVQRSIADSGLQKDYVQMAVSILKDPPTKENAQLRQWAISVLAKNSPVPIPSAMRSELLENPSFLSFFPLDSPAIKWHLVCKPVPNPETLEWLISNDPGRYVRCPNGEVGERIFDMGYVKAHRAPSSPGSPASAASR